MNRHRLDSIVTYGVVSAMAVVVVIYLAVGAWHGAH
jgi:hypothetical protein